MNISDIAAQVGICDSVVSEHSGSEGRQQEAWSTAEQQRRFEVGRRHALAPVGRAE